MPSLLAVTILAASFGVDRQQLVVTDARGGLFVLHAVFRLEGTSWREAPAPTTRVLLEPGKPARVTTLTPATWFVIGQVGPHVISAVVVTGMRCNDVELGPAPRGKIATCRTTERSASAVFVDDPATLVEQTLPPSSLVPAAFDAGVQWERRDATHVDGLMLPFRPSIPRAKFERAQNTWRFIGVEPGE